jgi:hypothetical protein
MNRKKLLEAEYVDFRNHTFTGSEILQGSYVTLYKCTNFPKRIEANHITIEDCGGEVLPEIHSKSLTVILCKDLKYGSGATTESLFVSACPKFETFNGIEVTNDANFSDVWRFQDSITTRRVSFFKCGKLPSLFTALDSVVIDDCGFRDPDIDITAGRNINLVNLRCRSITAKGQSIEIHQKKHVRDIWATAPTVRINSKQLRKVSLGEGTTDILIRGASNLEEFQGPSNYRRLYLQDSKVVVPLPENSGRLIVPNVHPNQKGYLFFGSQDEGYIYFVKNQAGEKLIGVSTQNPQPLLSFLEKFRYGEYLPNSVAYRGKMRRKILLAAEQMC